MASASTIKSYLVSLGFKVENNQLAQFNEGLKKAARAVEEATGGITKGFVLAGATITGALASITAGTVGLMNHVAQSDLDMQLFARRMYLSTDAARKMKTATDALGYSIEEIVWGPPELAERYRTLIADQNKMLTLLGRSDFEKQMKGLRDIRFEFTRLNVEMKYFSMFLVRDLSKALFGDENSLLLKLQKFSDWFMSNMPAIAQSISNKIAPAMHEMGQVLSHLGTTLANVDWAALINNVVKLTTDLIKLLDLSVRALNFLQRPHSDEEKDKNLNRWGSHIGLPHLGDWLGKMAGVSDTKNQIIAAAQNAGIDPAAALAIAAQESGMKQFDSRGNPILGQPTKYGRAIGMFQLLPKTAQMEGVDPGTLSGNIQGGVNYLSQLYQQYGNWHDAFKHYNGSGPAADAYAAQAMQRYSQYKIEINVNSTNASKDEIKSAVVQGVKEAHANEYQRLLAQRQGAFA